MIVPTIAKLIVREHLYKPIQGKVLTLGRQTIALSYEQAIDLLRKEEFEPSSDILRTIVVDQDQRTRVGKGTGFITDDRFFGLLGITELQTMDVTEYEGCDIVHNLNQPIPESLFGQYDFIIDGGTFDHLFDLRVAFENVVKMLKIGGRIIQWNAASNFNGAAYLSFGPDFFYDFYVLNQFSDCKVYIAEVDDIGQLEHWDFYEFEGTDSYAHFRSNRIQMTLVLAEKGSLSTYDKIPVQAQYRDQSLWSSYRRAKDSIKQSSRKPWVGSIASFPSAIKPYTGALGRSLIRLKDKVPVEWRRRFPYGVKAMAVAMLPKQITGYIYRGKI